MKAGEFLSGLSRPKTGAALHSATLAPAPDRLAYHEDGRVLAAEGELVTIDAWWMRRMLDEDVIVIGAPPPPAAAAIAPVPRAKRSRRVLLQKD